MVWGKPEASRPNGPEKIGSPVRCSKFLSQQVNETSYRGASKLCSVTELWPLRPSFDVRRRVLKRS